MELTNKVAIITGASSGIGAAIAILFSQNGANVVIVGRNETKLHAVAQQCNEPLVIKADITNDDEVKRIISETIERFGKLDVLVNNAGILKYATITDDNVMETYDQIMATHLKAVFYLTHLAGPHLIESKGNVINMSSVGGTMIIESRVLAYCVSKAGLDHFTRGAATEFAKYGVRVNTISPGPVGTEILETAESSASWEVLAEQTILKRFSEAKEIAELALFLASDKAKGITGSNFVSDNGMLLKR